MLVHSPLTNVNKINKVLVNIEMKLTLTEINKRHMCCSLLLTNNN